MDEPDRRVVWFVDGHASRRRPLGNFRLHSGRDAPMGDRESHETVPRCGVNARMRRHLPRSGVARYGVAVLCVAVTVAIALSLRPLVVAAAQLSLVAILIAGWVCGLRPALVAWGLATLSFAYFFTSPFDSFRVDLVEVPRLAIFALLGLFMATMSAARRRAENSLNTAREELETRVRERTADLERSNGRLHAAVAGAVAAQQRFSDLVNSVEGIVWEADTNTGRFSFVSDQAERILGYPVDRWLSEPAFWIDHLHPDDREWAARTRTDSIRGKRALDVEYRMIAADGRALWLRDLVTLTADDAQLRGVMVDVTERTSAEHRLVAQHQVTQILAEVATLDEATPRVLRAVCESLDWDVGALWRHDRDSGVLRCVEVWHKQSIEIADFEAASRATTFEPGVGLPGRVWFNREPLHILDIARDASFLRAPIVGRQILHAAFGFPILLGGEVLGVMEFFSQAIRPRDQELLDMMAVIGSQIGQFMDRKQAEEALRHARAELEHVTRVTTLGELVASIAHEVNQPLAAIVADANASLNWLAATTPDLDMVRESLPVFGEEGHRAAGILQRIRQLARKTEPHKFRLDVNDVVRDVLPLVRAELRDHGVSLSEDLPSGLPPVLGDRVQLQQVVLNLVMNGIEALARVEDRAGELTIRSRPHDGREVAVAG